MKTRVQCKVAPPIRRHANAVMMSGSDALSRAAQIFSAQFCCRRTSSRETFCSGFGGAAPVIVSGKARRPGQIHGLHVGELEAGIFDQPGNRPVDVTAAADLLPN